MPYCPCGRPIPEGKQYCSSAHRGRYHKYPARGTNFGMEAGKPAKFIDHGEGLLKYLYGRPLPPHNY